MTAGTTPAIGDPEFFAGDPYPALADLRQRCPVDWRQDDGYWVVTKHADIQSMSRDPQRFCSSQGVLLADRDRQVASDDSLLYLDPPGHAKYRQLVSRAFTPRRVAELEPRLRELTVALLDRIDPKAPIDVVKAVTAPLPLAVISELLGLPPEDAEDFRRWSDAIMEAATSLNDENAALALELFVYLDGQLEAHRTDPRDDLLGALLAAEVDGEHLSQQELLGFCMTLLVAGNETTRSLMSGGIVALAEYPDQRADLVAHPELMAGAVEEMLRWVTPIMAMARTTTEPVQIGTTDVGSGEYVLMVYGAGNRDEDVFAPDAERFNISRSPNPHLSFGFGEHFCIGAGLARLEARVLFSELLARWPRYELAGAIDRRPSTLFRQFGSVPVIFEPGS